MTITTILRFTRSERGIAGLLSKNRPSTDAVTALSRWVGDGARRAFDVIDDQDDYLVAELRIEKGNEGSAGLHLEALCGQFGLDVRAHLTDSAESREPDEGGIPNGWGDLRRA